MTKEESKNPYGADCKLRKGGPLVNGHGASPEKRPNKQDDSASSGFEIAEGAGRSVHRAMPGQRLLRVRPDPATGS